MWGHILYVRDCLKGLSYRAKLVLYALASRADKNGFCRPSTDTLVKDTGMSRRGVLRAIQEAEEQEVIIRFGGEYAGRTNRYQFTERVDKQVINSQHRKTSDPCQSGTGSPDGVINNPCQPGTPPVPTWHPK